jgi:hypothetical protein
MKLRLAALLFVQAECARGSLAPPVAIARGRAETLDWSSCHPLEHISRGATTASAVL